MDQNNKSSKYENVVEFGVDLGCWKYQHEGNDTKPRGPSNEVLGTRALQFTDLTEIHLFKTLLVSTHISSFNRTCYIRSLLLILGRCDVGVIKFTFHVLQLLPMRFTQPNLCCISKSKLTESAEIELKIQPPLN